MPGRGQWGAVLPFKSGAVLGVARPRVLFGRRVNFDGVAEMDLTLAQHSRVHSAPSRVKLVRDADEFSVDERRLDRLAGVCERYNLEKDAIAESQLRLRDDQIPIDSFHGHVLACGSDVDRMTFRLERADPFQRIQTKRPVGSIMMHRDVLSVSCEP